MKPFWREQPLSESECQLLNAVSVAHYHSTFRANPSTVALQCSAQGSGNIFQGIAAALMAFGSKHGPVVETYRLLNTEPWNPDEIVKEHIAQGRKVPGWGSSFTKDGNQDELWIPVEERLRKGFPEWWSRVSGITDALHKDGKKIVPNPSAFTSSTALALGIPEALAPCLIITSRMQAWLEIFQNETERE